MQQPAFMRSLIRHPLMIVLGVFTGAGAAKSGHGAWAAAGIVAYVPFYVGAVATCMMTRRLKTWVSHMRRRESLAQARGQARRTTTAGQPCNAVFRQGAIAAIACIIFSATLGFLTMALAQDGTRIRIRMGDQAVTATLNNSEAARDLAAMLPLSIRMRDHLRREKTGPVPRLLSERTEGSATYESGDLGYWRPGGNFVIFYKHDGLTIPSPGIVRLGKLDSGISIFDVPGTVDVRVERIN